MTTVASHVARPISPPAVQQLYRFEQWWPDRTAEQIRTVLDQAPAAGAWDGAELVGFGRAVTDGAFRAYIEDVIVAPSHRHRGLGNSLLDCLLEQLAPIPVVSLFCGQDLAGLYESAGFTPTRQVVMHRKI